MSNQEKTYEVIADTRKMTREQWLNLRHAGIGGSDCAPACGLSRWKTPLQLWLEKTNRVIPSKAGEAAFWGMVMEPILRNEFAKRSGYAVKEVPAFFRSKENQYMQANIDGCVDLGNGKYGLLEIKTAGSYAVQDWENGLPVEYFLQIQHYLHVCGLDTAFVAVLLGGNKFSYQEVRRDDDVIQNIIQMEGKFWEHVVKDTPPEAVAGDTDVLSTLYPKAETKTVEIPPEAAELILSYEKAKADMEVAKKNKEEAEAKIKSLLKTGNAAICNGYKISWTNSSTSRLDTAKVKELLTEQQLKDCTNVTATRRFSISKIKGK